jgi:esterase/lipase superfamily enzyme
MKNFYDCFFHDNFSYSEEKEFVEFIKNDYEKIKNNSPDKNFHSNMYTTYSYEKVDNNIESFKRSKIPLKYIIEVHEKVEKYIDNLDIKNYGIFFISDCWINAYKKNQFFLRHKHSNNYNVFFSGIHYLKFDEKKHSPTVFYNPGLEIDFNMTKGSEFVEYIPKIKQNDIIIFPSNVAHEVVTQNSDELRITISFNVSCLFKRK